MGMELWGAYNQLTVFSLSSDEFNIHVSDKKYNFLWQHSVTPLLSLAMKHLSSPLFPTPVAAVPCSSFAYFEKNI